MTNTYKWSAIGGILAGYGVLGALLVAFHAEPASIISDLLPFLAVGAAGLLGLAFAPNREEPARATSAPVQTRSTLFGCTQKLSGVQMVAFAATGFLLGALLHQVFRAFGF